MPFLRVFEPFFAYEFSHRPAILKSGVPPPVGNGVLGLWYSIQSAE